MSRGPRKDRQLLEKASSSALLALEIYNKPSAEFRVGSYIVLMCIAWTALLHAVFEKNEVKYYYRKSRNSRFYVYQDGEKKAWDLSESTRQYFGDHSEQNPVYENISFMLKLRNKIEHRHMPALEEHIQGECQAFIINFTNTMRKEFGDTYTLTQSFSIPLQVVEGRRLIPRSNDEKRMINFVQAYRNQLHTNVNESQEFSYKLFVMPQLANHRNSSDLAVQFVKVDPEDPEALSTYNDAVIAIKSRTAQVANQGLYRPKKVLQLIEDRTGVKNNVNWHTSQWKKYKVRPNSKAADPRDTDIRYCQFDEASTTRDYIYTDAWVDLLINDISNGKETMDCDLNFSQHREENE